MAYQLCQGYIPVLVFGGKIAWPQSSYFLLTTGAIIQLSILRPKYNGNVQGSSQA